MKKVLTMENLENNNSQVNYDAYHNSGGGGWGAVICPILFFSACCVIA